MAITGITFAVVGSNGHYSDVDAAIDAGEKSIFVKAGTSLTGWTHDVADVEVEVGPGCTITSGINISGNNDSVIFGAGCTVQGQIDVTTGVEACIEFMNGCTLQEIDINTARCYINGGGWGTIADGDTNNATAITIDGSDVIVENIAANTTSGGAGGASAVAYSGSEDRINIRLVKVIDSDATGFLGAVGSVDDLVLGCIVVTADGHAYNRGTRLRLISCLSLGSEANAIRWNGGGDCIMIGNVIKDGAVRLDAGNDNIVLVGNRIDTTITNLGTSNTVAANDLTGF